jgi:hypothetical protein
MNSGFNPVVVNPSSFRIQRQSQQMPFHFGGSQVPVHMATGGMEGMGVVMRINRPPVRPPSLAMSGGMLVEATRDEIDVRPSTKRQLKAFLNETMDLLRTEEREVGVDENTQEKRMRFPAIRRRIIEMIKPSARPISEGQARRIMTYLFNYTKSPIQPYQRPNF